jgi:hypothetical protein
MLFHQKEELALVVVDPDDAAWLLAENLAE